MQIRKRLSIRLVAISLVLLLATLVTAGCTPAAPPPSPTAVPGCTAGGPGIVSPADVPCTLDGTEPPAVQQIDPDTILLLADDQSIAAWPGAAIIFHAPTLSMLVLDRLGDVDPGASTFGSRAGLAALAHWAADPELMAGIRQQLRSQWQTAPPGEPQIRLGVAWQDGPTTVFLIAVAGLDATDDRLYCPGQRWTIGADTVEIVPDCVARDPGTPVFRVFFEPKTIRGRSERPVEIALDGFPSNVVHVREGAPSRERLIYQTLLQHVANRALVVRDETAPGRDDDVAGLAEAAGPALLQNYRGANRTAASLRFLFHDSHAYFVQPSAAVDRDYLPGDDLQGACARFRADYPGLGGVVTLSNIGLSDDGTRALVHLLHECGPADRQAAYFILARVGNGWQVTDTFAAPTALPALYPQFDYTKTAYGCGDIFVYKANRNRSEFISVFVDVGAFALSADPRALEVEAYPDAIGGRIDVYADSVEKLGENPYCNDVGPSAVPQTVWTAIAGTVTLSATSTSREESCNGEPYQATVLVENLVFVRDGEQVRLPSLSFEDVTVGWCAG